MELVIAAIAALALITSASIPGLQVRRLRKENFEQHEVNKSAAADNADTVLQAVKEAAEAIHDVEGKLDRHIEWHLVTSSRPSTDHTLHIVKEQQQ